LREWELGVPQAGDVVSGEGYFFVIRDTTASATARFFIKWGSGNVGIGTSTPGYTLEVNGSAHRVDNSANWTVASDRRLKRDITELSDSLATLERLRPVRFRYTEEYEREHPACADQERFGVVAQEFREVFPEYVSEDKNGLLSVDISPITFYNTAALHELHEQLKHKEAQLQRLEKQNENWLQRLEKLERLLTEKNGGEK